MHERPAPKHPLLRLTVLFVAIGAAIGVMGWFLRPHVSHQAMEHWVRSAGAWGPVALLGIQAGQIVAAPIPGVFVPLIAGVLYGPFWGSLFTVIGTVIGSAIAFWIGRAAGREVTERWIGHEPIERAQKLIRGKRWLALIPIFLFPFSPADALCFMVGIAGVGWPQFLVVVLLGRVPKDVALAVSAAMGWSFLGAHAHHG